MKTKKRLLSGIQPSGKLHIGNYFGAMRQFVEYQEEYESFIMIADLHALTTIQNRERLKENIFDTVVSHLAVGLDPEKVILFRQSDISEHTELTWIFSTLVSVSYAQRAHAYKDKIEKGVSSSVGLLTYPILQASDILLYSPDIVPVGEDQRQHIEYARDIATKFNSTYETTFKLPKAVIKEDVAIIPGTDGEKMSKSYGNTIELFSSEKEIEKKVMAIPTDSKDVNEPKDSENDVIFNLHKLFAGDSIDVIRDGYEKGGLSYSESKKLLIKSINDFIKPFRERYDRLHNDKDFIFDVLGNGAKAAKDIANRKMEEVKEKIGLKL